MSESVVVGRTPTRNENRRRGKTVAVVEQGAEAQQSARVYTVPTGTPLTGDEPNGSLWVEYEQA